MNFKQFESPQKLRGGYYTPPDVADFLTRWVLEASPQRLLEPACGDGAFLHALVQLRHSGLQTVVGCEVNPVEAQKARSQAKRLQGPAATIHRCDFLGWAMKHLEAGTTFDAVVGNPPFIRYQYLDAEQQTRAGQLFRRFGLRFTKHTNAWVPFVVAALGLLRDTGRLALVVPTEILHVLHAQALREFLLAQCSRVVVLDPESIWFGETLQGVVLLLAEKNTSARAGSADLAIVPLKNRACLRTPANQFFQRADFCAGTEVGGKWMVGLLSRAERSLLAELRNHPQVRPFQQVADVDVGIVTGANQFFLVPDAVVKEFALADFAHPMFGRSDHVRGVIFTKKDHAANRRSGLPAQFLWFDKRPLSELPAAVRRYLQTGERQGLPRRYKCRIRKPWYSVPSVYAAPVAMLKRSHHFPRLVLNRAKAFSTDTAYRIVPKEVGAASLVAAFVNSLTALSCELEGRHYGGGVLELVPSEIERVLLPAFAGDGRPLLADLDKAVRSGTPAEALLARQDKKILGPLGIDLRARQDLLAAWARLRTRRQRTTSDEGA